MAGLHYRTRAGREKPHNDKGSHDLNQIISHMTSAHKNKPQFQASRVTLAPPASGFVKPRDTLLTETTDAGGDTRHDEN